MKAITNFIGGLAGAAALTVLHETVRRLDADAPRIDLVGQEGMNRLLTNIGAEPLEGDALYMATLAGDLISNAVYYSIIGAGSRKFLLARGAAYGLAAGIGNVELTKSAGLNASPVTRTEKTKLMTIAYYMFGGIIAALAIKKLSRRGN